MRRFALWQADEFLWFLGQNYKIAVEPYYAMSLIKEALFCDITHQMICINYLKSVLLKWE